MNFREVIVSIKLEAFDLCVILQNHINIVLGPHFAI